MRPEVDSSWAGGRGFALSRMGTGTSARGADAFRADTGGHHQDEVLALQRPDVVFRAYALTRRGHTTWPAVALLLDLLTDPAVSGPRRWWARASR